MAVKEVSTRSFSYGVRGWGGGGEAGGVWRVAPEEYDDPPPLFIRNFFGMVPLYPKIIEMTHPPQKKKWKKIKLWLLSLDQIEVLNGHKLRTDGWLCKGVCL